MGWYVTAILLAVLVVLFRKSNVRKCGVLMRQAARALGGKDWAGAERLMRQHRLLAERLAEPLRTRVEGEADALWAIASYRQGKMRDAEERFRSAVLKLSTCCPGHPAIAHSYLSWGDLAVDEGRYREAEDHHQKALAVDERTGNQAMMVFELQRLSDTLMRQERNREAEEIVHRAIALETQVVHAQMLREKKDPARHQVISMSMPDLHYCRGQYEDARRLYRAKVRHWEKMITRPDNIDVGHLQMRLAGAEAGAGDRAAALEMYQRAAATFQREWSENHPKAAVALARMSRLLCEEGRLEEARETGRTALAIFDAKQISEHPEAEDCRRALEKTDPVSAT